MKSVGIILLALATGASAHPFHLSSLFGRQAATCDSTADCPDTQFCPSAGSVCETFDDCRGTEGSCPGGTCAPSPDTAEGDPLDPTRAYVCVFADPEPEPSSSAASTSFSASVTTVTSPSPSASSSSAASVSSSISPAPSASATAAPGGACAINTDCALTQFCDLSGETAFCAQLLDCRGEAGSCPGGFCVPENSTFAGDAQDPSQSFICSFESAFSSSSSLSSSASVSVSISASMSRSPSPSSSTAAPTTALEPSTSRSPSPTAAPSFSRSPVPEPSTKSEPAPEHSTSKSEATSKYPKSKPTSKHSKEEHKPAPTSKPKPEHGNKDVEHKGKDKDGDKDGEYCDQLKIESLLWEIKGELKGLKWEVEQLKEASKH